MNNNSWDKPDSDPIGDIASIFENFKKDIGKPNEPIVIGVVRGSPIVTNLLNMVRDIENVKVVINVCITGHINHRDKLLVVDHSFTAFDNARRYMELPDAIVEEPNNKPWYQDHKHFKNKKSRRKL